VGICWLDAKLDRDAGLDGDAKLEDARIDGDDVSICGMCTGEGGIHVAIVGMAMVASMLAVGCLGMMAELMG